MRFPWRETRVAVAALARAAFARAARRAASRAFSFADDGAGAASCGESLDTALSRAETHADHVEARLCSFPEPPFTAQRLVELLLDPEASGYRAPETLRRACDKLLAVTGMTAIDAGRDRTHSASGALEQSAQELARRALDPVSLEQSAFVRALVGEAEAKRGEDEDEERSLDREKQTRLRGKSGETTTSADRSPYAAFPGEALPGNPDFPGSFVGEVSEQKTRPATELVERVGEKRAREGASPEPTFAEEMDALERRLPGKPDVGAELVTAGA